MRSQGLNSELKSSALAASVLTHGTILMAQLNHFPQLTHGNEVCSKAKGLFSKELSISKHGREFIYIKHLNYNLKDKDWHVLMNKQNYCYFMATSRTERQKHKHFLDFLGIQ